MNEHSHILLAMSGGVDSSVAAALLKEAGCEVTGVFMHLGEADAPASCAAPGDVDDARAVADRLGIELREVDLRREFSVIVEYFLNEYARGRTPNPCIHCNARLKFGRLMRLADELGIPAVATGHYARLVREGGEYAIRRGRSGEKDQSYALFAISAASLPRIVLPIGELPDKQAVRDRAERLGLDVHDKPDSQEICFVEDDDYAALLERRAPQALRGGRILDTQGNELGRHEGFGRFTIGQRRGIGVAAGVPMYVTRIDPDSGDITIGTREEVSRRTLRAGAANWHRRPDENEFRAIVQVRYNHRGAAGAVRLLEDGGFEVRFDEPVHAITPGQAAVIYHGDRLLGGGWIDRAGEAP